MLHFKALWGIGEVVSKLFRRQAEKPVTRFNYTDGPMSYIGQKIVQKMEKSGYPAKIHCLLRTPEEQAAVKARGVSRADPFESPHQYYEAVDIIHADYAWFHPSLCPDGMTKSEFARMGADFWRQLNLAARVVAEELRVELVYGHDWGWDSAHIETKDWKSVKAVLGRKVPTREELEARFMAVLPKQWNQHQKSVSYATRRN